MTNATSIEKPFQSTPSRGGRHFRALRLARTLLVSIHALTRRATWQQSYDPTNAIVSIHALTRRATHIHLQIQTSWKFQSTPSRGGRPSTCSRSKAAAKFQSTPSRGGRHRDEGYQHSKEWFQSTPSRGGRHSHIRMFVAAALVSIHALTRRATRSWRRRVY